MYYSLQPGSDFLTGLLTRQNFILRAQAMLKAANLHSPVSFILLDIVAFRQYNILLSFDSGDYILRHTAYTIQKNLPKPAILARWQKDQFIVAVPAMQKLQAQGLALYLSHSLSAMELPAIKDLPNGPLQARAVTYTAPPGQINEIWQKLEDAMQEQKNHTLHNLAAPSTDILPFLQARLKSKLPYMALEILAVPILAGNIGKIYGLDLDELNELFTAALWQDLAMAEFSLEIIQSPRPLKINERELLLKHPGWASSWAKSYGLGYNICQAINHHHEAWGGQGYPLGLIGAEIPFYSRILSLATTYIAMTSARAWRGAFLPTQALWQIQSLSGKEFDPDLMPCLRQALRQFP